MNKKEQQRIVTSDLIQNYRKYLEEQEKSPATIKNYLHGLTLLQEFIDGMPVTKQALIAWKAQLTGRYAAASVNTMLAAANGFMSYCGWEACRVKPLKIQRDLFCKEDRELTRQEYLRLVRAAERRDNQRLSLVLQAICSTGIRVSELRFITAEAVSAGRAVVNSKGKIRTVFLPGRLKQALTAYMRNQKRRSGPVFITRTGKPIDRSNIWRDMKSLCESAGVEPGKVFPHNLRHLFARTYYSLEKDLSRLADILGHTSVSTTRIYTMESGAVHRGQIERMGLVIT